MFKPKLIRKVETLNVTSINSLALEQRLQALEEAQTEMLSQVSGGGGTSSSIGSGMYT